MQVQDAESATEFPCGDDGEHYHYFDIASLNVNWVYGAPMPMIVFYPQENS